MSLGGSDEATLRAALAEAFPDLLVGRLDMGRVNHDAASAYAAAAVFDSEGRVIKFAWSDEAARSLAREAALLKILAPALPVPDMVLFCEEPALVVTVMVQGRPLSFDAPEVHLASGRARIATQLGGFLARLHQPSNLTAALQVTGLDPPVAQATTGTLRRGLRPWVRADQWSSVERWCEWIDATLAVNAGPAVLLHGDVHGYNEVWSDDLSELRIVVDWAGAFAGDAEFDLRYIPAQAPGADLVQATMAAYRSAGGRPLQLDHVLAWHTLTVLGDALWRSEAGIALPDGRTPPVWVDDLDERLSTLLPFLAR